MIKKPTDFMCVDWGWGKSVNRLCSHPLQQYACVLVIRGTFGDLNLCVCVRNFHQCDREVTLIYLLLFTRHHITAPCYDTIWCVFSRRFSKSTKPHSSPEMLSGRDIVDAVKSVSCCCTFDMNWSTTPESGVCWFSSIFKHPTQFQLMTVFQS